MKVSSNNLFVKNEHENLDSMIKDHHGLKVTYFRKRKSKKQSFRKLLIHEKTSALSIIFHNMINSYPELQF